MGLLPEIFSRSIRRKGMIIDVGLKSKEKKPKSSAKVDREKKGTKSA